MVERYDRIIDDGPAHVFRLRQEDVCYRLTDLGNAVSVRLGSGSGSTIRCWLFLVRGQILVEELPHPIDRLLRSLDCDVAAELRDPAVEHRA